MTEILLGLLIVLALAQGALLLLVLKRPGRDEAGEVALARLETLLRDTSQQVQASASRDASALRTESRQQLDDLRRETAQHIAEGHQRVDGAMTALGREQREALNSISANIVETLKRQDQRLGEIGSRTDAALRQAAQDHVASMTQLRAASEQQLEQHRHAQQARLADHESRLYELGTSLHARLESMRQTVREELERVRNDNAVKLDQMRSTVEEKLQQTLNARLSESFRQVSDRLEQVHKGLGEMQTLATGVGDLRHLLTNVKQRGTWGEYQLGALLEQVLAPDQFARNVSTRPGSRERVEFAIRLPGPAESTGDPVWLPVDAKFPQEDYQRLCDAAERADAPAVETAARALEAKILSDARSIHEKYVEPPYTTDFAILFVPTEGLYAEVIRRPGLVDQIQREHRIVVAGPTTLHAILSSLQMGFRTLAIQKRSSEVWSVLSAVKTEFAKFGTVLAKVQKKLNEASNEIENSAVRSRAIERKLRSVESLPEGDARQVLALEHLVEVQAQDGDDERP